MIEVYEEIINGEYYFTTPFYTINVERLLKTPGSICTEYTRDNVILSIIGLMNRGITKGGLKLFIQGKFDTRRQLKEYCNQFLLPYKTLAEIIKPKPF